MKIIELKFVKNGGTVSIFNNLGLENTLVFMNEEDLLGILHDYMPTHYSAVLNKKGERTYEKRNSRS